MKGQKTFGLGNDIIKYESHRMLSFSLLPCFCHCGRSLWSSAKVTFSQGRTTVAIYYLMKVQRQTLLGMMFASSIKLADFPWVLHSSTVVNMDFW